MRAVDGVATVVIARPFLEGSGHGAGLLAQRRPQLMRPARCRALSLSRPSACGRTSPRRLSAAVSLGVSKSEKIATDDRVMVTQLRYRIKEKFEKNSMGTLQVWYTQ